MPYIKQSRRNQLILGVAARGPGELNYLLTREITRYVREQGLSYQTINDVLGALDGASKEFYRRVAAPYEDSKIQQNGDVYHD